MLFLFNTKIPSTKKRLDIALLKIFGLNHANGTRVFAKLGLRHDILSILPSRFNSDFYLSAHVRRNVQHPVGLNLKNLIFLRLRNLKRLKNFKSFRHSLFLPVRGQRTKKNSQTQKGRRGNRRKIPVAAKKK